VSCNRATGSPGAGHCARLGSAHADVFMHLYRNAAAELERRLDRELSRAFALADGLQERARRSRLACRPLSTVATAWDLFRGSLALGLSDEVAGYRVGEGQEKYGSVHKRSTGAE